MRVKTTTPETALAWCLYAALERSLDNPQGYVRKRLTSGDPPDARYLRWARLTAGQWRALWLAVQADAIEELPGDLQACAGQWQEDFGDLWYEHGPFGDQKRVDWIGEAERRAEEARQGGNGQEGGAPDGPDLDSFNPVQPNTSKVWQYALSELQMKMTRATFDTWVRQTTVVSYEDGLFIIGAHNGYAKDWLENRLCNLITETLSKIVGCEVQVQFVVWNEWKERADQHRATSEG